MSNEFELKIALDMACDRVAFWKLEAERAQGIIRSLMAEQEAARAARLERKVLGDLRDAVIAWSETEVLASSLSPPSAAEQELLSALRIYRLRMEDI